jgi:hypothetical protein
MQPGLCAPLCQLSRDSCCRTCRCPAAPPPGTSSARHWVEIPAVPYSLPAWAWPVVSSFSGLAAVLLLATAAATSHATRQLGPPPKEDTGRGGAGGKRGRDTGGESAHRLLAGEATSESSSPAPSKEEGGHNPGRVCGGAEGRWGGGRHGTGEKGMAGRRTGGADAPLAAARDDGLIAAES